MNARLKIFLLQFDQPDKSIWADIISFAEKWNDTKENKFIITLPYSRDIYFFDEDDKNLKELEKILQKKGEENNWIWTKSKVPHYPTREEKESCDYIQIIGDGYPDEFLLNESDALSSVIPCEKCGTVDSELRVQKKTLQIDETFLDKKTYPNYKYTPSGVDLLNMPHGALLVSNRVTELIEDNNKFYGCTFLEVINQKKKISVRFFELATDKIILLPDNLTDKKAICPVCGTELLVLTNEFAIKKDRLEGSSFFSRSPSGLASIYISNDLYHFLKSENVRGLTPVQGAGLIFN
jgi:hypothetical protein